MQSENFIIYALWSAGRPGFTDAQLGNTLQVHGTGAQGVYNALIALGYQPVNDPRPGDIAFFGGNPGAPPNVDWTHEGIVGEDGRIWHLTSGHGRVSFDFEGQGYLYSYDDVQYVREP